MEPETRKLQELYRRFINREISISDAAQELDEFNLSHKIPIGTLDLEPMTNEQRDRVCELLRFVLEPIETRCINGKISVAEAATRIVAIVAPHTVWSLATNSSGLSALEQRTLHDLSEHILKVLESWELVPGSGASK